jgi:hypothetical protein
MGIIRVPFYRVVVRIKINDLIFIKDFYLQGNGEPRD